MISLFIANTLDAYPALYATLFAVLLMSFLACHLLARLRGFARRDHSDLKSRQSSHDRPTLRFGGLAIFLGLVTALSIADWSDLERAGFQKYLITLVPILFASISEDFGYHVRPGLRFLAIALSSSLALVLFDIRLVSLDVPVLDPVMTVVPVSVIVTIFAASGVTNGFNLIDGMNGLASGYAILCALALSALAHQVGLVGVTAACLVLAVGALGFFGVNFPRGRLFLGDTGAYLLGHTLVWIGIGIHYRAPDISAFSILLIFFCPVADTLLAMYRRRRSSSGLVRPDRLHLHQLAMRSLEISWLGRRRRNISNPLTAVLVLATSVPPLVAGIIFSHNNSAAFVATLLFATLYASSYYALLNWVVKHGRSARGRAVTTSRALTERPLARSEQNGESPKVAEIPSVNVKQIP